MELLYRSSIVVVKPPLFMYFALVYSPFPLVHVNNDVFNLDDIIMVNVYEKACLLCYTRGKHHGRATRVTTWATWAQVIL